MSIQSDIEMLSIQAIEEYAEKSHVSGEEARRSILRTDILRSGRKKYAVVGKLYLRVEYVGRAGSYHTAADEERSVPTIDIDTKDKGNWGLYEDEIVSIEEV